jgi:hypothetical protein
MVNRAILEQAFAEGGSVLIKGEIITRPEDLPSDLELAEGDSGRQAAILAQMEAELAAKQAELDAFKAQRQTGTEPTEKGDSKKPTGTGQTATETDPEAEMRARLESLTVEELRAEAAAEGIHIPAIITKKGELVNFLIVQAKE